MLTAHGHKTLRRSAVASWGRAIAACIATLSLGIPIASAGATARAATANFSEHAAWYAVIQNLNTIARNNNAELGLVQIVNVSATCTKRLTPLQWACDGLLYYASNSTCLVRSNPAIATLSPHLFDFVGVKWVDGAPCIKR